MHLTILLGASCFLCAYHAQFVVLHEMVLLLHEN